MNPAPEPAYEILAVNMRLIRERQGLSLTDVALRAGLSERYVGQVEDARAEVRLLTLGRLADALSTTPGALLTWNH